MTPSRHHIIAGSLFAFFGVLVPLLNHLGLVADTTLNLWGRYFCFASRRLGDGPDLGIYRHSVAVPSVFLLLGWVRHGDASAAQDRDSGRVRQHLARLHGLESGRGAAAFWQPFHSLPLTLILGLLVPGLAALVFVFSPSRSRIKGVYLAIITQALALAMCCFFAQRDHVGRDQRADGFQTLLGFELAAPATKRGLYVVACAALVGAYYLCRYIVGSKLGKLLVAIRDSEHRLRFIGYPITRYKLFVFVVASALAGLGGMLYVPQTGIITPGRMDVQASIEIVVWTAVGGRGDVGGRDRRGRAGQLALQLPHRRVPRHLALLSRGHFCRGGAVLSRRRRRPSRAFAPAAEGRVTRGEPWTTYTCRS